MISMAVTVPFIFGKMHFLLISENEFFSSKKCNRIKNSMEFMQCCSVLNFLVAIGTMRAINSAMVGDLLGMAWDCRGRLEMVRDSMGDHIGWKKGT